MDRKCATCLWWSANHEKPDKEEGEFPCWNPAVGISTGGNYGTECPHWMGPEATEANVPQHTKDGTMREPNPNPVDGPTELLIVTHYKDFAWLVYALRCAQKYLRGFQGITVAFPLHEEERFRPLLDQFNVRLFPYPEIPGKGMLQHMVMMASADQFLPSTTKYVLTCDADCMFRMPTTPEHYFWNDKPYCIIRSWASLTTEDPRNPGSKVVSDCLMWKAPTDRQLGFDTPIFGMCMNTIVFPIDFFSKYRQHIESVHKRDFQSFMLDGQNAWPQSNMDFTAMVAYAHRYMNERFHWFDVERPPYPEDRKKAYWSHGGLLPDIVREIEGFLAYQPTSEETERMAQ